MIDSLLRRRLEPAAERRRQSAFFLRLGLCWGAAALLGLLFLGIQHQTGRGTKIAFPAVAIAGLAAAVYFTSRSRKSEPDWRLLAQRIEKQHPELDGVLLTAVQQQNAWGELGYLQRVVIGEAIEQSYKSDWSKVVPRWHLGLAHGAH